MTDSPPLARGAREPSPHRGAGIGLTPARAGSTPTRWFGSPTTGTHPRSRGEHTDRPLPHTPVEDSPPLARGARLNPGCRHAAQGLTPARAGSTSSVRCGRAPPWTHPRSRGEHRRAPDSTSTASDSPPLARGAPHPSRSRPRGRGLTPARAGSTSRPTVGSPGTGTHPRSRGEHPCIEAEVCGWWDSPPLARGARGVGGGHRVDAGLTPARAGSTRGQSHAAPLFRTHPRSRGEHAYSLAGQSGVLDSPPLARGARVQPCGAVRGSGLTPARAGSTLRDLLGYGYLAQAGHGRRGCGRPPRCFWCPLTNRVELRTPTQPGG